MYPNQPNGAPQWNPNFPPPPPPRDNGGFAVASFVVGLVGLLVNFCCIPYLSAIMGILALVFGFVSLRSSKKGMAIAGIILGAVAIVIGLFVLLGAFAILGYDGVNEFIEEFERAAMAF